MYVVKMGGASGIDFEKLCEDVASLWRDRVRLVLVHGGSNETNQLAERLNTPQRFVTSVSGHTSRVTDRETLHIFSMATAAINRRLVERLQSLGVNAFGLSGLDGRLIEARRKEAIRVIENGRQRVIRDDWTGTPERVNAGLLLSLLDSGYLPVVAPLGISPAGEMLNVDGDRAAAAIARSLRAEVLLLLTNVPGLLRNYPDEDTLVRSVRRDELESASTLAEGRMRKKIMGAAEALAGGVARVVIADGRRTAPLSTALSGEGTVIE
ncbi:MAG TPA: [LysW]-aminoadipate kinase [Pyrinomonadaceae bacterium]|nr:[LysW]-aminoadipate kinase [Pyrinomonadaceae bacterium]